MEKQLQNGMTVNSKGRDKTTDWKNSQLIVNYGGRMCVTYCIWKVSLHNYSLGLKSLVHRTPSVKSVGRFDSIVLSKEFMISYMYITRGYRDGMMPKWSTADTILGVFIVTRCVHAVMGFAVRVRSAGQKYGPTCHQRDRADVTEFVTLVRLSSLGQHVGVLALAGYKRRKSALAANPIRLQGWCPVLYIITKIKHASSPPMWVKSRDYALIAPSQRLSPLISESISNWGHWQL